MNMNYNDNQWAPLFKSLKQSQHELSDAREKVWIAEHDFEQSHNSDRDESIRKLLNIFKAFEVMKKKSEEFEIETQAVVESYRKEADLEGKALCILMLHSSHCYLSHVKEYYASREIYINQLQQVFDSGKGNPDNQGKDNA